MSDEKLFQFLVSRVSNRESVSLALASITSSASLVLVALFFVVEQTLSIFAIVLGILFPVMALIHIEITYQGIHKHDHYWIRKLIKEDKENKRDSEKILLYTKGRKVRIILIRLIFSLPIFGWYFVIDQVTNSNFVFGIIATLGSIGVIFGIFLLDKIKKIE